MAMLWVVLTGAFAQNHSLIINNGATFLGNGRIVVKDSIVNNNSSLSLNIRGTVVLNGGAQTLVVSAAGGSLSFDTLSVRGNGEKRVVGTIAVAESLNILSGALFNIYDDTLRIGRFAENAGTLLTNENTVIEYLPLDGVEQTVLGGTYRGKIRLAGNARKRLGSVLTVDSLEQTGGALRVNHNLTVNGRASIDSILTITNGATLTFNADSSTVERIVAIEAGTQLVATNAALTIRELESHAGIITGGTRRVTFVNPVTVNAGSIVAGSGDVEFRNAVTLGGTATVVSNNASDSLAFLAGVTFGSPTAVIQLNGSGVASFVITPTIVAPTNFSLAENSTVYYSGTDQTVLALQYGTLGFTGSGTKTFAAGEIGIRNTILTVATVVVDAETNAATVNYNGTGAQTIAPLRYRNLMLTNDHGNQAITLPSGDTITVSGTFTNTATNYTVVNSGSVFEYNGASQQILTPFPYFDVVLSGTGEKVIAATQTTYGSVEQKAGTPVTVANGVDWTVEGSLVAGEGFVNNGTIILGSEL